MSEINRDPLEDLLMTHKNAIGEDTSNTEKEPETPPVFDEDTDEDIYGVNDLANEIADEDARQAEEKKAMIADREAKEKDEVKITMPPDERDMKYHEDAIGFQSEKLSIVSLMVQKVVAKYSIISGGIPEKPVPELGVLGRRAVMGELIDIYHNNGEKITPEFERMILNNWLMPDGTLAINNVSQTDGKVVDKTKLNESDKAEDKPETDKGEDIPKPETPTINITVEKNTPVTVNVDESVVAQTSATNEVNIHVKEVSEKELMKTTIVENSNQEGIIQRYDSGINDVPITLPMSGYRCVMRAINWFDFIKLTAPTSQNNADNELKRWSVIYDHIKNPSIGEFESFEDFMKKTKFQDRELLMWGLLVATADDEEILTLTCGNPKCKNKIRIKYNPRTIVHLDESKLPKWYIPAYEAAAGEEAYKIWEQVNSKRTRYKLPNTGIIAEINEPSAYEFVTVKLPLIQELFKRYRPEGVMSEKELTDVSMAEFDYLSTNALFVSALTIVREENGKQKEYRFTNWEDIEKIITTSLDAEDSGILLKIIEKSRSNMSPVSFRVEGIDCPVCGMHEDYKPIDDIGKSLLFQVSRLLCTTQITLIDME